MRSYSCIAASLPLIKLQESPFFLKHQAEITQHTARSNRCEILAQRIYRHDDVAFWVNVRMVLANSSAEPFLKTPAY